jgi:hypothetical protein
MGNALVGALEIAAKYILPSAAMEVLDRILPRENESREIEEIQTVTQVVRENNELLRSLIAFYAPEGERLHSVQADA